MSMDYDYTSGATLGRRPDQASLEPGTGLFAGLKPNVGEVERIAAGLAGMALIAVGSRKSLLGSLPLVLLGGGLVMRSLTGHCPLYDRLGISTSCKAKGAGFGEVHEGVLIKHSILVDRRPSDVFRVWRDLENLPHFMENVESVRTIDSKRSRWVVRSPVGPAVAFEAEIINERPEELIAWKTVSDADVEHAGSVRFHPIAGGERTEVEVELNYEPPAGRLGSAIAHLTGEDPEQQLRDDLRRFKQWMESRPVPHPSGQPGRS